MSLLPWAGLLPLLIVGYLVVRLIRFRGLRGALVGARISQTIGEARGPRSRLSVSLIRVHKLDGAPERAVGVEIANGESMMIAALSQEEAGRLANLLNTAIR